MVKTSDTSPGLCSKRVRPCGGSSEEQCAGSCAGFNVCFSGVFVCVCVCVCVCVLNPIHPRSAGCSGRVWALGRRSRSLSSSSNSSHRAHLEKPELCPRREAEGMMSCARPSLSSHSSTHGSLHTPPPPLLSPPLPLWHVFLIFARKRNNTTINVDLI